MAAKKGNYSELLSDLVVINKVSDFDKDNVRKYLSGLLYLPIICTLM